MTGRQRHRRLAPHVSNDFDHSDVMYSLRPAGGDFGAPQS